MKPMPPPFWMSPPQTRTKRMRLTRHSTTRWRRGLVLLSLTAIAALVFRAPIGEGVQHLVQEHSAKQTLISWGLEPTRENVALYLSMEHGGGLTGSPVEMEPFVRPQTAIATRTAFSPHWTYEQLFESPPLRIGIYNQDPEANRWIEPLAQNLNRTSTHTLFVHLLHSREELIRSFAEDTIVLYFGHANIGRGILFGPPHAEAPIRMGSETLVMPEDHLFESDVILNHLSNGFVRIQGGSEDLDDLTVNCKVFGFFGCRTDLYYRDIWQERFPTVDFIGTTYVCHTTALAPALLHELLQGIGNGRSFCDIITRMNQKKSSAILFGRINEVTRYRNPSDHATELFTCQ